MSNRILLEIEDLRDKRRTAEQALEKAKRARTGGLAGVLVGLILLIPLPPLGLLLLLAGGLAAVTQIVQANYQNKMVVYYDGLIRAAREKI